jgi:sugar lactone lactonase YvrE
MRVGFEIGAGPMTPVSPFLTPISSQSAKPTTSTISQPLRSLRRPTYGRFFAEQFLFGAEADNKLTGIDMVVDRDGRAYVANIGFDHYGGEAGRPTVLTLVEPDGTVRVVADDLLVPKGMVITPERELIVAESWRRRLTSFDIRDDGTLINRRVFADLEGVIPDGICLDRDGAIWFASLHDAFEVVRVERGGKVLDRVSTGRGEAIACVLGGDAGRTLYVCVSDHLLPGDSTVVRSGRIEAVDVDVPAW